MTAFTQGKLFLKKKFTFTPNGIDIYLKDSDGEFTLFIAFDKIGPRNEVRIFTKQRKSIMRIGFALGLLTIFKGIISIGTDNRAFYAATATAVIIGIMFYGYYYFTTLKYYAVPLKSGKHFQILYNSPSREAAEQFLDEVYTQRNAYMRDEYFFIDYANDHRQEIKKMKWLFDLGVITDQEYNSITAEIKEATGY